ncbi:hypothetical protein BaRGS_00005135 [Batillaria attramentaria]|uniref:Major facilitator superfamily (MFS) profile domain-containing protein n=1 Tax=Batillaria attramentaria TaxID=370345 RepID=A0ABD0LWV2_9CAEN
MATNIDPTLRALGSRAKYQMLQLTVISLGAIGAGYQLLDNVFIGRAVEGQKCSPPSNSSTIPDALQGVDWESSHVEYGKCHITVNRSDQVENYDCLFGYSYGYPREFSFRTEFDLVCGSSLLGAFAQSLVIIGQGFGAVASSFFSDRYGRKKVLVISQIGLLVVGMAIGLAPSYAVLATLKFVAGAFQQGVVTSTATMTTELFPTDARRITVPMDTAMWGFACTSMALVAYLMKGYAWRYLQYALSAVSIVFLFQLWYVDESLYWLVANGRKKQTLSVLKRAARTNGKDLNVVLQTLQTQATQNGRPFARTLRPFLFVMSRIDVSVPAVKGTDCDILVPPPSENGQDEKQLVEAANGDSRSVERALEKSSEKLTLLDIFRHKRMLFNSIVMWSAWFVCAFSFFALIMMSTSLVGDRFLNYALIAFMETPPGFIFYFSVNRLHMFIFSMVGAAGMFDIIFFYTPEIFPTNMRNQALGVASFVGRLGGMLAPFMTDFAEIAVWAPGVMIGSLCFIVVFLFRFLPETQGTKLPQTIGDMKAWYKPRDVTLLVAPTDQDSEPTKK